MASAAGSAASVMGRPTTMWVAPAAIASAGVTTRTWSPWPAPAGRTPGVTIDEIVAELSPQPRGLARGGDDALTSVIQSERRESQHFIQKRSANPDFLQIAFVQACEHRDAEHNQCRVDYVRCIHRSPQHLAAACGMHGQHAHAQLGCFVHRGGYGVGYVVIFQVEEDAPAGGDQIPHQLWAFGGIELHADFIGQG